MAERRAYAAARARSLTTARRRRLASLDHFSLLDALPDQAAIVDKQGVIVRTNLAWDAFSQANGGAKERTGVGASYLSVCAGVDEEMQELNAELAELIAGARETLSLEYPCHSPRELRWFLMRARRLPGGGALITHTDITQRKLAELRAERLASHDPLTMVLNRRGFAERLAAEMSRVRRRGGKVSAILMDIDNFKEINSRAGHAVGDIVLVEVARRCCEFLRAEDLLARIGGDEFLAVLPLTNERDAMNVAERLRMAVASSPIATKEDGDLVVTCSAAVAELPEECVHLDQILRACRVGLLSSKTRGKNRTTGSPANRDPTAASVSEVQPSVVRQSIVRLADGSTVGYELLARGTGELSQPMDMFRQASESGMLLRVDLACLHAGLRRLPEFSPELLVHVNIYPSTLLAIELSHVLDHVGVSDLRRLCFELSEQEIVADPSYLRDKVRDLRDAGISLAIDDVGFGRTCLENLVTLEPATIKIDRRLTYGVARDRDKSRQLERVLRLAGSLGASVVAEGIEYDEDACLCRDLGIELGQGYLWGRPQSF